MVECHKPRAPRGLGGPRETEGLPLDPLGWVAGAASNRMGDSLRASPPKAVLLWLGKAETMPDQAQQVD
jgi:hypothetical protein